MNFKVFSILALIALVFVFTTTANPAEENVTEMANKSEHASEDHAAGKLDAAPSHHVKKDEPSRHAREAKAAQHAQHGTRAPKAHSTKKTKYVPKAAH